MTIGIFAIMGMFSLAGAAVDTLTILHLNDTHSHLLPYGPKDAEGNWIWGGMSRIATLIGMNKISEPNVLLLHSGDIFVGDFMFQKYLGQMEEPQCMPGGRRVPHHEVKFLALNEPQDIIQHVFLLYPGCRSDVIHKIIIHIGEGGDDLIDFRAKSFPPHIENDVGTDFDAVKTSNPFDRGLPISNLYLEDIGKGRGWIAGNDQGFPSQSGEMDGDGRGAGRLSDSTLSTDHNQLFILAFQIIKGIVHVTRSWNTLSF